MTMGKRIKEARVKEGFTQAQLAELCGLATITIQQYERDKRQPRRDQLEVIAQNLNVTTGYLWGIEDINAKAILDAMKNGDYRTAEDLMDLPVGSIGPVDSEEQEEIEYQLREERHTKELVLNKLRIYFRSKYDKLTDQDYLSIKSLIDTFSQLNEEGQQKAVERVEELTEIPKYKNESSQNQSGEEGTE
ncbi:MAG: helix-turn-helix transcriptional regulator [Ruminococcaceae bacterium]|nr:helix-turn-helix transcriptional regulator [Oscillospiraceae bacterium]